MPFIPPFAAGTNSFIPVPGNPFPTNRFTFIIGIGIGTPFPSTEPTGNPICMPFVFTFAGDRDKVGETTPPPAEAKSSSSGRVRAPRAGVGATTSNVTVLDTTAAFLTPASSELLASTATVPEGGSDVAGARRVSARKCAQADPSGASPVSSNKPQKKLEDPLKTECLRLIKIT
ncbi:hypothetical protein B0H13DRAFT_2305174 [Mycena leptocephala]|nr:hypothetical protein B0H13DRAFT_2305174 [Mycena leptocephala]